MERGPAVGYDSDDPFQRSVVRKVALRLVPLIGAMYSLAYLDRINIGSAALTMNKDLQIDATVFGFASSMFLAGYFFLEIPSNIAMVRFGARIWLTRIMLTWGVLSALTAFIQDGTQLVISRVLLGIAEAGLFPGMVLYLALWFPKEVRGRIFFWTTLPFAVVFGAPLSTAIIQYTDGWFGLAGWRIMYFLEGIPAVLLAAVTVKYLTSWPAEAAWLTEHEREWLSNVIEVKEDARHSLRECFVLLFSDARLVLYAVAYGLLQMGFFAILIFTPQLIAASSETFGQNLTVFQVGALTALPSLVGTVFSYFWCRHSDLTNERIWHAALGSIIGAAGALIGAWSSGMVMLLGGLILLKSGLSFALIPLWQLPTRGLSANAAAVVVAAINSVGLLFSFMSPILIGWLKDRTGSYESGFVFMAIALATAGLCIAFAGIVLERGRQILADGRQSQVSKA